MCPGWLPHCSSRRPHRPRWSLLTLSRRAPALSSASGSAVRIASGATATAAVVGCVPVSPMLPVPATCMATISATDRRPLRTTRRPLPTIRRRTMARVSLRLTMAGPTTDTAGIGVGSMDALGSAAPRTDGIDKSMARSRYAFGVLSCAALASLTLLGAARPPVPPAMLGTWAHGSCATPADRLVITARTAALGGGTPQPIYYSAQDGDRAIHWSAEGNVDNFVYFSDRNVIVHNTQGYHMPGAVLYRRCRTGRSR